MRKIGIMQGRLSSPVDGKIQSFPKSTWMEEFFKARECGLGYIEWIFENDEWERNPISLKEGIDQILALKSETGIPVLSVCADYFMDVPYLTADSGLRKELSEKLVWLVTQAKKIGARFIDIPFVDASKIESEGHFASVKEFLAPSLSSAEKNEITLALETSLPPAAFKRLLSFINHPWVNANYDTGNSSGIGYDCEEELRSYGRQIMTLHIKDRLLNDGTKPLGTGSANFDAFFRELSKLDFKGPIILQAAREEEGREKETAIKNRLFVERYLTEFHI
jgi:hexulose-6-phosphate isomerase